MSSSLTKFGRPMREHFLFDDDWLNLNHGSFGTYPKPVRDFFVKQSLDSENHVDQYIRYKHNDLLDASREAIAKLIHAPLDTVTFVANATTGTNTVLRNLVFSEGDVILYCDTVYGALEKTVLYICETTAATSVKYLYDHPVSDADLVAGFRAKIKEIKAEGKNVKIATFDTVSSMPGLRVPFEELTTVCREEGVLSCIDAAHAVGMIPLDMEKLDPDFLVSNCHKWLYTPRSCAVFYVPLRNQPLIRSTVPTSHGFIPLTSTPYNPLPNHSQKSSFIYNFQFTGTVDNSPFYCVPAALKFREEVCGGEERIYEYLERGAREAGEVVAGRLGTRVMENEEGSLGRCAFAMVELPLKFDTSSDPSSPILLDYQGPTSTPPSLSEIIEWAHRTLIDEYKTFVPFIWYKDSLSVRLSSQIYLERADWEKCGEVLEEVCGRVGAGDVGRERGKVNGNGVGTGLTNGHADTEGVLEE